MRKYNNIILLILMITATLSLLSLASAQSPTLGVFKQNQCINLIQTCPDCSYSNISSILYPNSSQVLGLVSMTKLGTMYNYTFCNTNTSGIYLVNGYGDLAGTLTTWNYNFEVTPSGTSPSTTQGIIYTVLMLVSLIFFLITLYGAFMIDGSNYTNDDELVITNNKKYIKMGLFFLAYILMIWLSFNLWNLSQNFLTLDFMTLYFRAIAMFLISALLPVTLIFMTLAFVWLFIDKRFQKMFERGIPGHDRY